MLTHVCKHWDQALTNYPCHQLLHCSHHNTQLQVQLARESTPALNTHCFSRSPQQHTLVVRGEPVIEGSFNRTNNKPMAHIHTSNRNASRNCRQALHNNTSWCRVGPCVPAAAASSAHTLYLTRHHINTLGDKSQAVMSTLTLHLSCSHCTGAVPRAAATACPRHHTTQNPCQETSLGTGDDFVSHKHTDATALPSSLPHSSAVRPTHPSHYLTIMAGLARVHWSGAWRDAQHSRSLLGSC